MFITFRWIYYGQEINDGNIYRLSFDGKEKRVIINHPSVMYGIKVGM